MKSKRPGTRGFTLIELLVVISIISLMSSIVLASLSAARDKATIAAGQQFSGQVQRSFGSEAVIYFPFDTTTPVDESGNNNTLTCGGPVVSGIKGSARSMTLSLVCTSSSINYSSLDTQKGAISFWIYHISSPATACGGGSCLLNARFASWIGLNSSGMLNWGTSLNQSQAIPKNKWTHVLISWDNSRADKTRLFINGKLDSSTAVMPTFTTANYIYLGGYSGGGIEGYIDEFAIYNQSI